MSDPFVLTLTVKGDTSQVRGELRQTQTELAKLGATGGDAGRALDAATVATTRAGAAAAGAARQVHQEAQAFTTVQSTAAVVAAALGRAGVASTSTGAAFQSASLKIDQASVEFVQLESVSKQVAAALAGVNGPLGRTGDEARRVSTDLSYASTAAAVFGRRVQASAGQANQALSGVRNTAQGLNTVLAGVGLGYGLATFVRDTIRSTEAVQALQVRLDRLTGSAQRAGQEQGYLEDTARRLSVDVVTLGDNWARMLTLVNSGVLTLQQGRQILEGMANVAAATGASNVQLGQSFFGLSQGLSAGTLRAEEFNQVTEPLPGIAQALDREWGRLVGSTDRVAGSFRRAVVEGQVTSEMFAKVMVGALQEYDGAAEALAGNLRQQFNRLGNEWTLLLEEFARPTTAGGGLVDDLTDVLAFLRENIELTRVAVLSLGGALLLALGNKALLAAIGTLGSLLGVLATPLGLVVAGATALGIVLQQISDDGVDAAAAVDIYRDALRKTEEARAAGESGNETLARQLRTVAEVAMAAAEAIRGIALAHYQARISDLRQQLASLPSELEVERTTAPSAAQRQRAETRAAVEGELSKLLSDPDYRALQNPQSIQLPDPTDPETPSGTSLPGKGGAKDALRDLLEELDPMRGVLRELAEDQALLNGAFNAGKISAGDLAVLTAQLKERYREALDPLGAMLDTLREETQLLALSGEEREIQAEMLRAEQALREHGLSLGAAELEQLRTAIVERRREQAAASSRSRQAGLSDQLTMLRAEIDLQSVGREERELALALLERELELKREGLDLTSRTAQEELDLVRQTVKARQELAGLQEEQNEFGRIAERAFDRIGEAVTQAFADGSMASLDFGQIAMAVLSELLQEMLRIAVLNPLKKAFGDLLGGFDFSSLFGGGGASTASINTVLSPTPYGIFHEGGIVGQATRTRAVNPAVFLNARRYHGGGLVSGEVPAILQEGEEVLTEQDPRHRRNGGHQGPGVEVHIHEAPGTKASTRSRRDEGGKMRLDVMVEQLDEAFAQLASRGDSKFSKAQENLYGLSRGRGRLR